MNTLRINDIDIRHEISGQGPWLILIHALACDLTLWDAQMPALACRFRVLRYDIRGHGGTSAPPGPYQLAQLRDDLLGLMDALGIAKAHLAGISLGGMIAQYLALAAPERIDRLALISTTSGYPPEGRAALAQRLAMVAEQGLAPLVAPTLARWFTPAYQQAQPQVMSRIGQLIAATPVDGYLGCGAAIGGLDTTAQLGRLTCPTLIINAAEDVGTPPAMGRIMAERIGGSRFELIEAASHLCNIEQAERFNQLLVEHLLFSHS